MPESGDDGYRAEEASLYFEGALACRAMEKSKSDPETPASQAIADALERWEKLDDEQGQAAAHDVTAVLALDRGDLELAYQQADMARAMQDRVLRDADPSSIAAAREGSRAACRCWAGSVPARAGCTTPKTSWCAR